MLKQFGGKITKLEIEKYALSNQWKKNKFENLEETTMDFSLAGMPKFLKKQLFEKEGREPKEAISIEKFDKEAFLEESVSSKFIWFGHSVVLMRMANKTILIDPMFGPNAAPIAPFKVKRFSINTLELVDVLPEIDIVLITHDHYDHLDMASILKLKTKVKQFYVSLGVKRHLVSWGIEANCIMEFDWWESKNIDEVSITFTPTRHFSGRGLSDRAKSLWGGWVLKTAHENLWFSGDGGYGSHFIEIGKRLGPFDFAFMECGQYNPNWHAIHMYPEESVQAAIDANAKTVMAVHWAGFSLAQHPWTEPIERFMTESEAKSIKTISPKIGQMVNFSKLEGFENWWQ